MSWVDIVIIIGAIIGAVAGYRQGLVMAVFSFLGMIVGVAIAGAASDALAGRLSSSGSLWASIVAFAIILVAVLVIFNILGRVVKGALKLIMLGWLDTIGGAFLGMFVGGLVLSAIFIAIGRWAPGDSTGTAIGNSALAGFLIDNFRFLLGLLPGKFDVVRNLFD